jgi:class 3 adenylate cyclase
MFLSLFKTRSDRLSAKLKARTRQLNIIGRLNQLRDGTTSSEEYLEKAVGFIAEELISRYVAVVLKTEDALDVVASTSPEFTVKHETLLMDMANAAISARKEIVINRCKPHPRLHHAGVRCALVRPIFFKEHYIGAIVVFRFKKLTFGPRSRHSAATIADNLPASLDYIAAGEHVTQKSRELKLIESVGKVRDRYGTDTQLLLNGLTELMGKETRARGAFIVLYDIKAKSAHWAAVGVAAPHKAALETFAKQSINRNEATSKRFGEPLGECFCVPAIIGDAHAAFGIVGPTDAEFEDDDKRMLVVIARQGDSALVEDRNRKRLQDTFSKYVAPEVLQIILKNPDALKTERHEATLLFADMRGFTALAEKVSPEIVAKTLNEFFSAMTQVVLTNKGTVDKFVGDQIVAIFGAPVFFEDHAKRAVKTAIEMQRAFNKLRLKWQRDSLPTLGFGTGLDSGTVVVGNIGGEARVNYTAIGDHVNTAARICGVAEDGQNLITQNTWDQVKQSITAKELPAVTLKGKSAPVRVFNATSMK